MTTGKTGMRSKKLLVWSAPIVLAGGGVAAGLTLAPAGTPVGTPGRIYLRIYLAPQSPAQLPLPTATATLNGVSEQIGACSASSTHAFANQQPDGGRELTADATKLRAVLGVLGGIFPFFRVPAVPGGAFDANDAYLGAYFNPPRNGDLLLIRGKAPTTPAGSHPSPWPAPGTDVQCWSLCDGVLVPDSGLVANPLPGGRTDYGCRYDSQVRG
jgi:hypothetical protein